MLFLFILPVRIVTCFPLYSPVSFYAILRTPSPPCVIFHRPVQKLHILCAFCQPSGTGLTKITQETKKLHKLLKKSHRKARNCTGLYKIAQGSDKPYRPLQTHTGIIKTTHGTSSTRRGSFIPQKITVAAQSIWHCFVN